MKSPVNIRFNKPARFHWLVTTLLTGMLLLAGVAWHFTANAAALPAETDGQNGVTAVSSSFTPFVDIVPSQDGTELYISARSSGVLSGTVFANIGIGPGHQEGSYTMSYSDTLETYIATAAGFTPGVGASGPINITTTSGLDTGSVEFNRSFVPAATSQTISSLDGKLQLTLVSTDTFTADTYVAIVPSYGLPGPLPSGHRLVGSSYSVRAPATILTTTRLMSLRLAYDETALVGADPHTLAIFAWDAANKCWDNLGGRLFYDQKYLSVATNRFTTYALMATTTWRDAFDDFNGLSAVNNVTLGLQDGGFALVLAGAPGNGTAVSKPITPTTTIESWGVLTFTYTAYPPTTTLTIDVLSLDGAELLTNVPAGGSLMAIDPTQHPGLKLRANFMAAETAVIPSLDQWQLTWQTAANHKIFLPLVQR